MMKNFIRVGKRSWDEGGMLGMLKHTLFKINIILIKNERV